MEHTIVLERWGVTLRPATPDDARVLQPRITPKLWAGMATPFPHTPEEFALQYNTMIADSSKICFSVLLEGEIVGRSIFYDYVPGIRAEVGSTFYVPEVQGSHVNPACKYLLFEYAFDQLHLNRIGLRCDSRNQHSANAIRKLGAKFEGVARGYRPSPTGQFVDTDQFSIVRDDWPVVKTKLLERLQSLQITCKNNREIGRCLSD